MVTDLARESIDHHQARVVTRKDRMLSDQSGRQVKVEFLGAHDGDGPSGLRRPDDLDSSRTMQSLVHRLSTASRDPWPDRPVPIALVITDLDVGGAERTLVNLATRLDRRLWQPLVVCLSAGGALVDALERGEVSVRCLDVDRRRPLQAVARLAEALRPHRPSLIQSFLFHANVASRLAAPRIGLPWVVGGIRVAEKEKQWHLRLERMTRRLCTGAVCVSVGVRRHMHSSGWEAERLMVIPNGIEVVDDPAVAAHELLAWRRGPDTPLALFVGRIDAQKGIETLLAAADLMAKRRPDWRLAMAGDGPLGGLLEGRREARSSGSNILWLGHRSDVPALLAAADLLVLPSLWEGMPNVILEAMAAGKAVIATDVEGSNELVVAGESGWLVPKNDPVALAAALIEAADDPSRSRRYGQAGRERARRLFSIDLVVSRYQELWSRVLGFNPPRTL